MAEEIKSASARAVEELVTYLRRLPSASSISSSSPHDCDIEMMKGETRWLGRTLIWIRATLTDAEKMEIRNESDRRWLKELEGVACDAEDVLDDLVYEARLLQLQGHREEATDAMVHGLGKMVEQVSDSSSLTPSHDIFAFLDAAIRRMKVIHSKYDEINKHREHLKVPQNYGQGVDEMPVRQPTSPLIEKSCVFGRERDLEMVKNFLLSDEESNGSNDVPVMAIVGMGGLGKTTLAQLAYNDDEVNMQFQLKSWVCVSENLDVVRLTRAMVEHLNLKACGIEDLNTLQVKLTEKLAEKKFLLVLDDVWEVEQFSSNWGTLTAPLRKGSTRCKILVTTRSDEVSEKTRAVSTYHLPCLQDEDCLRLFNHWVFEGRDPHLYQNLEAIGRKISERCRGLPLVAKTLGGLLCRKDDERMWKDILKSDIWDIRGENEIMPILRLSYKHLPAHLKRCFRYCSVFPKGYRFNKDRLVRMWMAHGYIRAKEKKLTEGIGKEYFDDLLCKSFFQYSQDHQIYFMHDLIHDLARCISEECYSAENYMPFLLPEHVQHISFVSPSDHSPILDIMPPILDIPESSTLRSFLFITRNFPTSQINNELFIRVKHVRVLDLTYTGLRVLPNSIGCLKHLRYLGLRDNPMNQLPESIGRLYHLQTLDLESSDVECLPSSISNLLDLRHIVHNRNVAYPAGVGKLTNLQTLAGFRVSLNPGRAKVGELKDMNEIRSLLISSINNLIDVEEAKKACLAMKTKLQDLHLRWDTSFHSTSPVADQVMESLRPNTNIEQLHISYFEPQFIPSWLKNPDFTKLATVKLEYTNWSPLPPLGQLPSLKHLSIWSANQVEYIGREFFSEGFPLLEVLQLEGMTRWKSWCGAQRGECPHLRELTIANCPRLESLSVINLDALQQLDISFCSSLRFSPGSLQLGELPSLQNLYIKEISEADYISGVFSHGSTSSLYLTGVDQLGAWSSAMLGACTRIRHFSVTRSPFLASLPFSKLDALEYLEISGCPQLQFSYEDRLSTTVQVLIITSCEGLMYLPVGNVEALEEMRIRDCPRLRFSNEVWLPPRLKLFFVDQCPLLTEWCQQHRQRLAHIRQLAIQGIDKHVVLKNVFSLHRATDAFVWALQRLRTLELEWDCNTRLESFEDAQPEAVLEHLHPHNHLNRLVIQGYIGSRFATWLGDPSFSSLVYVTLLGCSQCELLPPLGQLPHLMELYIGGARMLRRIGVEFFYGNYRTDGMPSGEERVEMEDGHLPCLCEFIVDHGCRVMGLMTRRQVQPPFTRQQQHNTSDRMAFPSLRRLEFNDMPNWEEWVGMEDGHNLPSLCELILTHCPMLKTLPCLPPTLVELEVTNCDELVLPNSLNHLTSLLTLRISQMPILQKLPELPLGLTKMTIQGLPALDDLVMPPSLRDLVLQGCSEAMVAASLPNLTHITSLWISDFPQLAELPLHNMVILQELQVSSCPKLKSLDCFSFSKVLNEHIDGLQALKSLERLSISNCPKLYFYANERPPSSLRSMYISNCPSAAPWHDKHWRNRTRLSS